MGRIYNEFMSYILTEATAKSAPVTDAPPSPYKADDGTTKWKATRDGIPRHGFPTQADAQQWYARTKPAAKEKPTATKRDATTPPEATATPRKPKAGSPRKPKARSRKTTVSSQDRNELNPSGLYREFPKQQVQDVLGDLSAIGIETYSSVDAEQKANEIVAKLSDRIEKYIDAQIENGSIKLSRKLTRDVAINNKKEVVKKAVEMFYAKRNMNIEILKELAEKKEKVITFTGDDGAGKISSSIVTFLDDFDVNIETITKALTQIRENPTDVRDGGKIDEAVKAIEKELKDRGLSELYPSLAEHISGFIICSQGGIALFPTKPDFPLGDVLSITRDTLTGEVSVDTINVDTEDFFPDLPNVYASVKAGDKGAPSSNVQKILKSRFYKSFGRRKPIQLGIDPADKPEWEPYRQFMQSEEFTDELKWHPHLESTPSVQRDLLYLNSTALRQFIFPFTPKKSTSTVDYSGTTEKKHVLALLEQYRKPIVDYLFAEVGITVTDFDDKRYSIENLYDLLSTGTQLGTECVEDPKDKTKVKCQPVKSKESSVLTTKQDNPVNFGQWRNYSVVTRLGEILHNKFVEFQAYSTHKYDEDGGITIADGIAYPSGMEAQLSKRYSTDARGARRPEGKPTARTVPMSRKVLRKAGNPCVTNNPCTDSASAPTEPRQSKTKKPKGA